MSNQQELIYQINKKCRIVGGYDEFLLLDYIRYYCKIHYIEDGSQSWERLIDYLWENLDSELRTTFYNKNEFAYFVYYNL